VTINDRAQLLNMLQYLYKSIHFFLNYDKNFQTSNINKSRDTIPSALFLPFISIFFLGGGRGFKYSIEPQHVSVASSQALLKRGKCCHFFLDDQTIEHKIRKRGGHRSPRAPSPEEKGSPLLCEQLNKNLSNTVLTLFRGPCPCEGAWDHLPDRVHVRGHDRQRVPRPVADPERCVE
jgi:hypothetical protein